MANPATPCEICGKPATHHSTRVVNGEIEEHHFCAKHAAAVPTFLAQPTLQISLEELFNTLLSQAAKAHQQTPEPVAPEDDVRCGACKLPFSLYRKTMFLGCDRCYESFEDKLIADLRKFHGSTRHAGRRPLRFKPAPLRVKAEPVTPPADEAATRVSTKGAAGKTVKQGKPATAPEAPAGSLEDVINKARTEMKEAVVAEDFERAARLRDHIRSLEAKTSPAKNTLNAPDA